MTQKKTKKRSIFYATLLLILIIFLHYLGFLRFFEEGTRTILNPVSTRIHQISQKMNYAFRIFTTPVTELNIKNSDSQKQEIIFLKKELKVLNDENQELRDQLSFSKRNDYSRISAEVVGKSLEGVERVLIINEGYESGIKINNPVIVGEGILIGKISKVNAKTSFVRLINDNQSKVAATVLNKDKSLGIVEGGYGLSLRMNLIPRDETVLVEENIITSGIEEEIPKGLLIGQVAIVENEPYQPFQQAVLKPVADFNHLNLVSVIIDY